jgi:hypothetical protein
MGVYQYFAVKEIETMSNVLWRELSKMFRSGPDALPNV